MHPIRTCLTCWAWRAARRLDLELSSLRCQASCAELFSCFADIRTFDLPVNNSSPYGQAVLARSTPQRCMPPLAPRPGRAQLGTGSAMASEHEAD